MEEYLEFKNKESIKYERKLSFKKYEYSFINKSKLKYKRVEYKSDSVKKIKDYFEFEELNNLENML